MLPLRDMQIVINNLTVKAVILNNFINDAISTVDNPSTMPVLDKALLDVQERKILLGVLDLTDELNAFSDLFEGLKGHEQSPNI
jgi:hypothetical protein